jgi:hypothetical protein
MSATRGNFPNGSGLGSGIDFGISIYANGLPADVFSLG